MTNEERQGEQARDAEEGGAPPQLTVDGPVALVQLRRARHLNRIEPGDVAVLLQHCAALRAQASTIRAVVITGSGRHFSSGYDVRSVLATLDADSADGQPSNSFGEMIDEIEVLPQVTVCAINGGVFGGATDLALACDFRVGVNATRMFMPAARLGLHYYPSGMRRFLSRLGLNTAKRLFLLGEELDSAEMLKVGYLNEIVSPESLLARACEIARKAQAMAPLAVAGMKASLNAMADTSFDRDRGAAAELACLRSADLREGVAAWHEKRSAVFKGC